MASVYIALTEMKPNNSARIATEIAVAGCILIKCEKRFSAEDVPYLMSL